MKLPLALDNIAHTVSSLLETIQNDMFVAARTKYLSCLKEVTNWGDFVPLLDQKNIVVIPWCEAESCEDDIKERSGRA